jgi:hypothetical protein
MERQTMLMGSVATYSLLFLYLNERSQFNDMIQGPFDTICSSLPRS